MDPLDILHQRLNGKTQRELAGELGISVQYLNDILKCRREPGPAVLHALKLERRVTYHKVK